MRALRTTSILLARHLVPPTKGKTPIRAPRPRELPAIGCSYCVWGVRSYASTKDARHEVQVGFMEDTNGPEDDPEAFDIAAEEDDAVNDEVEVSDRAGPRRPRLPTSQKKLNRLLSRHVMHDIPEHELSERFVKGTGPGGQAINKTNSAVHLLHIPTGIRIRAQPSRFRGKNREAARKILRMRLDDLRARGLYPVKEGESVAEEIVIDPETDTPDLPGDTVEDNVEVPETKLDKKARKEARKEEEIALSAAYSQSELRAAKIRARKLKMAKKAKKKKRDKGAAQGEGDEED